MVVMNTLLVVGTLAFIGGVLVTVLLGLLIAIYRNTRKDEEETGSYLIPAGALMGGPHGGGGMGGLGQLYAAAQAAKAAEEAAAGKKEPEKAEIGGQYI